MYKKEYNEITDNNRQYIDVTFVWLSQIKPLSLKRNGGWRLPQKAIAYGHIYK